MSVLVEGSLLLNVIAENKELINKESENNKKENISLLATIIVIELVLGGSGRLITIGPYVSIRYILFFVAIIYLLFKYVSRRFRIKKNVFYIDILLFMYVIIFSIGIGLMCGYEINNVLISSKGYLYILMYIPFSIIIDNKGKSKQIYRLFINCSVILALITLTIFVFFYFDDAVYPFLSPILRKFDYGYIALRGGLPAVFMKTSPFMAITFIIVLINFVNIEKEKNIYNIFKLMILLLGIFATMSMGIWIATFIGVIIAIVLFSGKKKIMGIATIGLLVVISLLFLSEYITVSLANRLSSTDSSFIIKFDQLLTLFRLWLEKPMFGYGLGLEITFQTELVSRTMVNFELFWIQILVNMGLIGLVVFLRMFTKPIYYTKKLSEEISFEESIQLKSLIIGLIVLSVISSVNPFLNNPIGIGYLIIVMSTVSAYLSDYNN